MFSTYGKRNLIWGLDLLATGRFYLKEKGYGQDSLI